ncbi:PREDICTED: glycophorin-A isoform X2 [Cercocebus atys]|uniref:glycophorin-A isoform X2 n=1 Tax=Cercocebus atys TaxID=9531 RepID=UPI0005F46CA1|nr:PREDICTED: glycophorin-A isoform X2 [Cercocebus atys]
MYGKIIFVLLLSEQGDRANPENSGKRGQMAEGRTRAKILRQEGSKKRALLACLFNWYRKELQELYAREYMTINSLKEKPVSSLMCPTHCQPHSRQSISTTQNDKWQMTRILWQTSLAMKNHLTLVDLSFLMPIL